MRRTPFRRGTRTGGRPPRLPSPAFVASLVAAIVLLAALPVLRNGYVEPHDCLA